MTFTTFLWFWILLPLCPPNFSIFSSILHPTFLTRITIVHPCSFRARHVLMFPLKCVLIHQLIVVCWGGCEPFLLNFNCLCLYHNTNLSSVSNYQFSLNLKELKVFGSCHICLKLKAIIVERQMVSKIWSVKFVSQWKEKQTKMKT